LKKILIMFLLAAFVLSLASCGLGRTSTSTTYSYTTEEITTAISITTRRTFDYSYDVSGLPQHIKDHLGEKSYTHISKWFEEDYNLDGDITLDELQRSYMAMLEEFDYDHIVTLSLEDARDMRWCIDEAMDEEYIEAAIYAIEYYDGIEWIGASWVLSDDCSSYDFIFSWITQAELYEELYEHYLGVCYNDVCYEEDIADRLATDFSTNAIAFNGLMLDIFNEEFNTYGYSSIFFIKEAMEDMTESEKAFVALHEMSHSFGLDDIYDEAFIGYTIMYGRAEGQDELVPVLRPFDLYNLAFIYNKQEE